MNVELLMSCMGQVDDAIVHRSHITGNVVVINQCDKVAYAKYQTLSGYAELFSVNDRGLCRSRNLAISKAQADICQLCDDDEVFVSNYESKILDAYRSLPNADVIIFKIANRPSSFSDKVRRLYFPFTAKVSSVQISFRRKKILSAGVRFDELLGAGSGNGAEEELKFLIDCQRAGLKIYYVPVEIASVHQVHSTWFRGFDSSFFEKRGATTRYILGPIVSRFYALYYIIAKRKMYCKDISSMKAWLSILRGIRSNPIGKKHHINFFAK